LNLFARVRDRQVSNPSPKEPTMFARLASLAVAVLVVLGAAALAPGSGSNTAPAQVTQIDR
jgi:hypothetical protein